MSISQNHNAADGYIKKQEAPVISDDIVSEGVNESLEDSLADLHASSSDDLLSLAEHATSSVVASRALDWKLLVPVCILQVIEVSVGRM
jgi:hypothetical protein